MAICPRCGSSIEGRIPEYLGNVFAEMDAAVSRRQSLTLSVQQMESALRVLVGIVEAKNELVREQHKTCSRSSES